MNNLILTSLKPWLACIPLALVASSGHAERYDDPVALVAHIADRAPSLATARERAVATRRLGASAAAQLPDTTLQVSASVLPIATRNGPMRAQFVAMQALPQFRARALRETTLRDQADAIDCEAASERLELRVATWQRLVAMASLRRIDTALAELHAIALDAVDSAIDESGHDKARQSDVLQAELVVHEIENQQIQIRRQLEEHRVVLAVWANDAELRLSTELFDEVLRWTTTPEVASATDFDVAEHPKLQGFDAAESASISRADALRASRRMQLAVMAQWTILTGPSAMAGDDEGRDALMLGVLLTLPTANREANLAAEAAEVDASATRFARQAESERLRAEVAELATRYAELTAEWRHIESTLVPVASDRVGAVIDELAHGRSSYDRLLDALETRVRLAVDQWSTWSRATQALIQLDATLNGQHSLTPWDLTESCSADSSRSR